MGRTLYLLSSGELKRKDNTIIVEGEEGRKFLPVETTDELMIFGEVTLNKRFLEFCTKARVMLHFFNHYGYYQGSYYPREHLNAGAVVLAQAEHFLKPERRIELAKKFVSGAVTNMKTVLAYYQRRNDDAELKSTIGELDRFGVEVDSAGNVSELMGLEGNARDRYYSAFDSITGGGNFAMEGRTRRPPQNRLNALISFLNSMCYVTALSQIYRTHVDPRIGYLHETNFRRFSLNLDLAEIFKPLLVDRLIFSLINKKVIQAKHFSPQSGGIYLSERGRPIVLKAWEERLQSTIEHPRLKRKVSYRSLLRMEAYKLEKHVLNDEVYAPFSARW